MCPTGMRCKDDPNDGCDPKTGGRDCGGICVSETSTSCASTQDCSSGKVCVAGTCIEGGGGICSRVKCSGGYHCEEPKGCVPDLPPPPPPPTACASALDCDAGEVCVAGMCIDGGGGICARVKCSGGFHCEEPKGCVPDLPPPPPPPTDCRTDGCDNGGTCSLCWGRYACLPKGAIC
jgi:hypothetical protein